LLAAGLSLATLACGGGTFDAAHLKSQGPAGERALEILAAHGGMDAYADLADLEYRVVVERYDATGALAATYEEVHRFPVTPPRRYVIRRTGRQVLEFGMDAEDRVWSRVDGMPQQGESGETVARQDLWVRSVLSRAPFCLADVDVSLDLAPDGEAVVATWPAGAGGEARTAIFFTEPGSGRLSRVVLQDPGMSMGAIMQSASAAATQEHEGVALIATWALSPTQLVDAPPGLPQLTWKVEQIRSRNGFTDRLYQAN
jgi:hypothetical protein